MIFKSTFFNTEFILSCNVDFDTYPAEMRFAHELLSLLNTQICNQDSKYAYV